MLSIDFHYDVYCSYTANKRNDFIFLYFTCCVYLPIIRSNNFLNIFFLLFFLFCFSIIISLQKHQLRTEINSGSSSDWLYWLYLSGMTDGTPLNSKKIFSFLRNFKSKSEYRKNVIFAPHHLFKLHLFEWNIFQYENAYKSIPDLRKICVLNVTGPCSNKHVLWNLCVFFFFNS